MMSDLDLSFDCYRPNEVILRKKVEESPSITALHLDFVDPAIQENYIFTPGQFNMLYLYGVGEVPISIVSDPFENASFEHAIRAVGAVTKGLSALKIGDRLGLRGPFGRGWPLEESKGKNIIVVTGGIGCAPVVAAINFILKRRENYGHLAILQGVTHSDDFIYRDKYAYWSGMENTQVLLAASDSENTWPWYKGLVTSLLDKVDHLEKDNTAVFMCGPEKMMLAATQKCLDLGISSEQIYLSLERNMQCGLGHCGHCQCGAKFVCKDGPVFAWKEIQHLLA